MTIEAVASSPGSSPTDGISIDHVSDGQIRLILGLSRVLSVPGDLHEMMLRVAESTSSLLDCERASIFLYDSTTGQLWTKVALQSAEIRVPANMGIVGHAFTHNHVVCVADPYSDSRFNPEPDRRGGFRTRNLLSAPMAGLDGKPMGVIQAVNKRQVCFGEADLALIQLLADQAGVALQRNQLQQQAMQQAMGMAAMQREMDLARRTQEALVPAHSPVIPGLACAGWTLPASTTGGDCFDLWKLKDGRLGILVADASGHGLAPALVVSQARTLVRALSDSEPDPHHLLARVNGRLVEDLNDGQFVTAFLGFLDTDGMLTWSSAGHGPLSIRPRAADAVVMLDPPVQPLGVIDPWFDGPPPPIQIDPGGSLLVVSDGIFEAANAQHELFGVDRMCAVYDSHRSADPAQIISSLREATWSWSGTSEPLDDQTIVFVRRV